MPRIRTIKPELWESPDVLPMDDAFQALFCWLISQADDAGRLHTDAQHIAHRRRRSVKGIEKRLQLMEARGMIARYEVEGRPYVALLNWEAHQRVQHPAKQVYPSPPDALMNAHEDSGGFMRFHDTPRARARTDLPTDLPIRGETQKKIENGRRQRRYAEELERVRQEQQP